MTIKDESKVEEVLDALDELATSVVKVGILEKDAERTHEDNKEATIGEIASVHEYGFMGKDKNGRKMNIPERSFIRSSFDTHSDDVAKDGEKAIHQVVALETSPNAALDAIGMQSVSYIEQYMRKMTDPPLKKATIKAKGSSELLKDTGNLREAIDYEIERG